MRVAVAAEGDRVSPHFGHCERFVLVDIDGKSVVGQNSLVAPPHKPGFLPGFLKEHGVNVVLAGGMGENAQSAFQRMGVKVIVGVDGRIDDAIAAYINGALSSTKSVCREHEHRENCGGH